MEPARLGAAVLVCSLCFARGWSSHDDGAIAAPTTRGKYANVRQNGGGFLRLRGGASFSVDVDSGRIEEGCPPGEPGHAPHQRISPAATRTETCKRLRSDHGELETMEAKGELERARGGNTSVQSARHERNAKRQRLVDGGARGTEVEVDTQLTQKDVAEPKSQLTREAMTGQKERKRCSVLSTSILVRGLPAFANEEWVAILIGRTSVAQDDTTGERKIYMYRDKDGRPTGSCVVGMTSVEEALRVESELDRKRMEGDQGWFSLRVRVVPRRQTNPVALPCGWQRFTDDETGREYYYDTSTGKTQWDAPSLDNSTSLGITNDTDAHRTSSGRYAPFSGRAAAESFAVAAGPELPQHLREGVERGWTGFQPQPTREVPGGYISSSGTFLPHLPRGSKQDMLMVDRKAHERAAKYAPVYGDPGFIHCIGPCQCRCRSNCVGLCTCVKCEVYPGTNWPMHPEIHRLRQLGIERTPEIYNSLVPPPGYVAGVGRGAVGYTLDQEFGTSHDDYKSAVRRVAQGMHVPVGRLKARSVLAEAGQKGAGESCKGAIGEQAVKTESQDSEIEELLEEFEDSSGRN